MKISHRRWLKNERWLKDYEENFKKSHVTSNPYFKLEKRDQATYAEVTLKPKKKPPPNQQVATVADPQKKQQTNLETIKTLLLQVQYHLNQETPRQQRKPARRHLRQSIRPKTSLYNPIFVQSDNDDYFLDKSTS